MIKKYLEVGKIVGTHGLKGEIKVFPWCNNVDFINQFKKLYLDNNNTKKEINVLSSKKASNKNISILKLESVDSKNQADLLRGEILYIDREDAELDEEEYFIQDLIGMDICDVDSEKKKYGKLEDVINTGANDIYQVKGIDNKEYFIPVIDDVVKEIDIENRVIYIKPMKGIFDDAD